MISLSTIHLNYQKSMCINKKEKNKLTKKKNTIYDLSIEKKKKKIKLINSKDQSQNY